jgi:hypothetical protein
VDAVQALSAFESNLRLFAERRDACYRLRGVGIRPLLRGALAARTKKAPDGVAGAKG